MSSVQACSTSAGHRQDRDDARRIRALERTVGELREHIRQLEAVLQPEVTVPAEWRLCRRELEIFQVLLVREPASIRHLSTVLYQDSEEVDLPDVSIHSHVSKLRSKTRRFGIQITCERNLGYRLIDRLKWAAMLG